MSQDPKTKVLSNGINFTQTIHNDTYSFIKPEQWDLSNHTIFITGASKGIGRDTALSFARAGASQIALGARSDMADLRSEVKQAAKKAGKKEPKILTLKLDVTDKNSVFEAADRISKELGRLDIVINNAGYLNGTTKVADSDPDTWWRTWEVNTLGPYLIARYTIPLLKSSSDGLKTILNVSSIAANLFGPGGSSYGITKLALLRFGEFISHEHGAEGLLSFGVHPGGVITELAKGLPEAMHGVLTDQPRLAADTFVWLTAQRREWLAGRYVSATWDMEQLLGKRENIEQGDLLKVRLDVGTE